MAFITLLVNLKGLAVEATSNALNDLKGQKESEAYRKETELANAKELAEKIIASAKSL